MARVLGWMLVGLTITGSAGATDTWLLHPTGGSPRRREDRGRYREPRPDRGRRPGLGLRADRGRRPAGAAEVAERTGEGGIDGLAVDERGRIYVADNGVGKIQRIDPKTGERVLIAEGMPGVASLVFGEGDFDPQASLRHLDPNGEDLEGAVGVEGARVHR